MKEIPILFSGPMVLAILENRKTQTRRTRGLDNFNTSEWRDSPGEWRLERDLWRFFPEGSQQAVYSCKCPYGVPGDLLWLKETWRVGAWNADKGAIAVDYKADGFCRREWLRVQDEDQFQRLMLQSSEDAEKACGRSEQYIWKPGDSPCRWCSGRFMPRWASRLSLENIGSRPERLRSITEEDARNEGVNPNIERGTEKFIGGFKHLWNKLKDRTAPWESNPTVWRIEFRSVWK